MSKANSFAAPPPAIATKAELDHLIESRPDPVPEPHLTPDGPDAADVRDQVHTMNENRLSELQERLGRLREDADRDFTFAGQEGRAKADFGHSR